MGCTKMKKSIKAQIKTMKMFNFQAFIRSHRAQIKTKKTKRFQAFIRDKKSQIKMSETIAVLFIFFVLVIFGIVFYYKYSQIAYKEKQTELLGAKAVEISLKTLFLPELICSEGEAEPEDFCFDLIKLRQAAKTEEKEGVFSEFLTDYYFDLFPYTSITVEKLYPKPDEKWVLYEKIKPDWERKETAHFIIALRDELAEGVYSFGVLTVEVYD